MQLSPHFTLAEFTKSQTAIRKGIDNTPKPNEIANLILLARNVLEPVRAHFGVPLNITSGFRCRPLNQAIGSSPRSQHVKGEAADFEAPPLANPVLARWIAENLVYDQVILEFYEPGDPYSGWVHVSYRARGNRKQPLTINKHGTHAGILE